MKVLIDQQLPATLAVWFDRKVFSAAHVRDLGMREAEDAVIWTYAIEHGAVIVTKDEDFAIRRARAATGPQILWLRIGNEPRASRPPGAGLVVRCAAAGGG